MRIRATAVLVKDNTLLMIHRIRNGEEYYVLPGGSVEKSESVEEATLRELKEETSLDAVIQKKIFEYKTDDTDTQLFLCEYKGGEPKIAEDSIEAQITTLDNQFNPVWISYKDISNLVIYPGKVKEFLEEYLN